METLMNFYESRSSLLCRSVPSPVFQARLLVRASLRYTKFQHVPPPSFAVHDLSVWRQRTSLHSLWRYRCSFQLCRASDKAKDSKDGRSIVEVLSTAFNFGVAFLHANFLPSILVSAVVLGLVVPSLGQRVHEIGLSKWATFGVFLISGLSLRTSELDGVLQAWVPLLFGVVSSLIITPLVAVFILQFPINPREFVIGLALFACMPTTLSSGVSLTQVAGANTALALSLTLISNFLGIFTMPLMISKLVAPSLGISVPAGPLVKSLVQTSLIPLAIGKVIRAYAAGFIEARKQQFSMSSAFFLGLIPWMQISCGRDLFLSVQMQNFVAAATLGMAMHCVFLMWNIVIMDNVAQNKDFYQGKSSSWAIILTASQKTLPVAITVIGSLGNSMGEPGLLVLPCLTAHLIQIIFDSFLVQLWIQGDLERSQRLN